MSVSHANQKIAVCYVCTSECAVGFWDLWILNYCNVCPLNRGESFRKEFSHLGDVRSLIPETVHVMALTATATTTTRHEIIKTLRMVRPVVVAVTPNKPNIKYIVKGNQGSVEENFAGLVEELRNKRTGMERTIIFCRTYDQCTHIYMYLAHRMGQELTQPVGISRDLPEHRLVDMFTACTHSVVKNAILDSLPNSSSVLRIIVATIAFGMGLDCPNIRRVIHWGPSADIESYLQETGRAGRDGRPAKATLYFTNTDLGQLSDKNMKEFCRNQVTCRREMLLKDFDETAYERSSTLCLCCDVCERNCQCASCSC